MKINLAPLWNNPRERFTYLHYRKRAMERFGMDVSARDYKDLLLEITLGKYEFISRQSDSRVLMRLESIDKVVVYDHELHLILTILCNKHIKKCDDGVLRAKKKKKKKKRTRGQSEINSRQ